jgi:hypothetical protein
MNGAVLQKIKHKLNHLPKRTDQLMGQYTSYANESSATVTFNETCNALFAQTTFHVEWPLKFFLMYRVLPIGTEFCTKFPLLHSHVMMVISFSVHANEIRKVFSRTIPYCTEFSFG